MASYNGVNNFAQLWIALGLSLSATCQNAFTKTRAPCLVNWQNGYCLNGGICYRDRLGSEISDESYCDCPLRYSGARCATHDPFATASFGGTATGQAIIIIVLIVILVIIGIALFFFFWRCRRKRLAQRMAQQDAQAELNDVPRRAMLHGPILEQSPQWGLRNGNNLLTSPTPYDRPTVGFSVPNGNTYDSRPRNVAPLANPETLSMTTLASSRV